MRLVYPERFKTNEKILKMGVECFFGVLTGSLFKENPRNLIERNPGKDDPTLHISWKEKYVGEKYE